MVVILPVGAAEEGRGHAGDLGDGGDIRDDLLAAELGEVGVAGGVVHHLMPCARQGFDGLGVLIRPVSHHKEGGLDVVLGQDVDEGLGVLVAPG